MSVTSYNKTRQILFRTANNRNKGFSTAFEWMEKTYRKSLDKKEYVGLMAELNFYKRYREEFKLTVAGDMGEHADFSGLFSGDVSRFDVTTNLSYKNFDDYEPFLCDGPAYRIAIVDPANYELLDIVSLTFERCECGGYKIPFILLMGENYNEHGESKWSNDQALMSICNKCSEFEEKERYTHFALFSPTEFANEIPDDMSDENRFTEINKYCLDAYKYFRREFYDSLMGLAEYRYIFTDRNGDGYRTFDFHFKNNVVSTHLPDNLDCGFC